VASIRSNPVTFIDAGINATADDRYVPTKGRLRSAAPSDAAREDYLSSYEGNRFAESMRYVRAYPTALPVLRDLLPEIQTPIQLIAGK
jgi:hypothetical protein